MTSLEGDAGDDAALFLGPGCPVRVRGTRVTEQLGVGTAAGNLPTVTKVEGVGYCLLGACGEVVLTIAVVISAQTADFTLRQRNAMTLLVHVCQSNFTLLAVIFL